jgi:hypothetical protein
VHDRASQRKVARRRPHPNGTWLAESNAVPRRPDYIGACVLLLTGCVAADIGEGEDPGLEEIEQEVDNGIFLSNGLNLPNGMNLGNGTSLSNGMNLGNGVDLANGMNLGNGLNLGNGITGPYYAPPAGSGLEQWIDVSPPARKKVLRYLVECALPAGVEVQLLHRGSLETLGHGILGLGPALQAGAMPPLEQEAVSACLLARVNAQGISVSVDLLGPMPGLDGATGAELESFPVREGVFFGNLFLSTPRAYACSIGGLQLKAEFRACDRSCGVLTVLTTLSKEGTTYDSKVTLRDCFGASICTRQPLADGTAFAGTCTHYGTWTRPMTTRLSSAGYGEQCFGNYQCEAGLECITEVCQ